MDSNDISNRTLLRQQPLAPFVRQELVCYDDEGGYSTSEDLVAARLRVNGLTVTHDGSGTLAVDHIQCSGNLSVTSDQSGNMIRGGFVDGNAVIVGSGEILLENLTISGNLTIDAGEANGGTVTVRNCVVSGNLIVGSEASLDAAGLIVVGNATIEDGEDDNGTVAWLGGTIGGTITDANAKLGEVSAGDFLNV